MLIRNTATLAAFGCLLALGACSNPPTGTSPAALDSGITSSNGGGMRSTGALPDASVTNGQANVGTMSSGPRIPKY